MDAATPENSPETDAARPGRKPGSPSRPITPVDLAHPVVVVMDERDTSRGYEVFNGPDAEDAALEAARDAATRTNRRRVVLRAAAVVEPPEGARVKQLGA